MNINSSPINKEELTLLKNSDDANKQCLQAFEIMLDFLGMKLDSDNEGCIIVRKTDRWKERIINLSTHPHNFLRINRVLEFLKNFGLSEYQEPLITFLIYEIMVSKSLEEAKTSLVEYWLNTVSDTKIKNNLLSKKESANRLAQNRFFAGL